MEYPFLKNCSKIEKDGVEQESEKINLFEILGIKEESSFERNLSRLKNLFKRNGNDGQ